MHGDWIGLTKCPHCGGYALKVAEGDDVLFMSCRCRQSGERQVLRDLRRQIGDLSVAALDKGGEPLFDKVDAALGVALRHCERIATGTISFTPAVEREMRQSIARAETVLGS